MTAQFRSYVRPLPMVVRRRHPLGFIGVAHEAFPIAYD